MHQSEWLISVWPPSVDKYVYIISVLGRTHNTAYGFTYQYCRHSHWVQLFLTWYQEKYYLLDNGNTNICLGVGLRLLKFKHFNSSNCTHALA